MHHVRIIDNHVIVINAGTLVLLCDLAEGVEEETVAQLHDIGLVNARDFLCTKMTTGRPVR